MAVQSSYYSDCASPRLLELQKLYTVLVATILEGLECEARKGVKAFSSCLGAAGSDLGRAGSQKEKGL
jgi:hypothetical protein